METACPLSATGGARNAGERLGQAIAAWEAALGSRHVIIEESQRRAAESATFLTRQSIPAILRPGNRAEVQETLRIANRFGVPLYAVSTGKNWGYGSRVPAADGCALVELRRLNRIVAFDEKLAHVTVEPGVTQRQLFTFLKENGSKLWMDATGASPDCSLIGNTMERGFGHTPYGDHFAHCCGLEVVLPDGEVARTGFAGWEGAHAAAVYRWGLGPSVDGLFTQSNLGIVTRMTVWLMPAPEYFQAFFFRCEERHGLGPLMDALRPLRLNGTLRSTVHVGNDYKVLSGIRQYPWEEAEGRTPLPEGVMARFRGQLQFGRWNGSGALYGSKRQVAEGRRLVRKALEGKVGRLQFLDEDTLRLAERFAKPYQWLTGWDLSRTLELARPVLGLMKGVPADETLGSVYWRKRGPIPAQPDPDRDGCGLLWYSPVTPLDGRHVERASGIALEVLPRHGFEPMISLSLVTERAVACVVSICYDRAEAGEDGRAMECYEELSRKLMKAGYPPYRLGNQPARGAGYDLLGERLKKALDPGGVLSPGRYARVE